MIAANDPLKGVIRGRIVELDRDPGLPDGARVLVVAASGNQTSTEGLLRAAGAWADAGEDLDRHLEQVRQDRKAPRSAVEP